MTVANLRMICLSLTGAMLCTGYAASQWFSLSGRAAEWTRVIDVPAVQGLAALIVVGLVIIGFVDRGEDR